MRTSAVCWCNLFTTFIELSSCIAMFHCQDENLPKALPAPVAVTRIFWLELCWLQVKNPFCKCVVLGSRTVCPHTQPIQERTDKVTLTYHVMLPCVFPFFFYFTTTHPLQTQPFSQTLRENLPQSAKWAVHLCGGVPRLPDFIKCAKLEIFHVIIPCSSSVGVRGGVINCRFKCSKNISEKKIIL